MNGETIVLLISAGLFVVLLLAYMCVSLSRNKKQQREDRRLYEAYSDENLMKMDYDVAYYDEASAKLSRAAVAAAMSAAQALAEASVQPSVDRNLFMHVEDEGIEEITGYYNPEEAQ